MALGLREQYSPRARVMHIVMAMAPSTNGHCSTRYQYTCVMGVSQALHSILHILYCIGTDGMKPSFNPTHLEELYSIPRLLLLELTANPQG